MSSNREERQKLDTFFRGQRALLITHPHKIEVGSNDRSDEKKVTQEVFRDGLIKSREMCRDVINRKNNIKSNEANCPRDGYLL
jgi:hypothetical protein